MRVDGRITKSERHWRLKEQWRNVIEESRGYSMHERKCFQIAWSLIFDLHDFNGYNDKTWYADTAEE